NDGGIVVVPIAPGWPSAAAVRRFAMRAFAFERGVFALAHGRLVSRRLCHGNWEDMAISKVWQSRGKGRCFTRTKKAHGRVRRAARFCSPAALSLQPDRKRANCVP